MTADAARYVEAAQCLLRRKARQEEPAGRFPAAGHWYPAGYQAFGALLTEGNEYQHKCCQGLFTPDWKRHMTDAIPSVYRQHTRSLQHISLLFGVDWSLLRVAVRLLAAGQPAGVVGDVLAVILMRQRLNPSGRQPDARQVRRLLQTVQAQHECQTHPTRSGTVTS